LIFVTVGAQMAFDRLIGWVDDWAVSRDRDDVCAQIGPSGYRPRRLQVLPFLDPPEFRSRVRDARAIVSHAGMGTILTALELGKPILVVPRLGALAETRTDHQVATARRFEEDGLVLAAYDEGQFAVQMDRIEAVPEKQRIGARASPELLSRLRGFVLGEGGAP
jgi:UDP-N-acetylglucosamine transferase subunit ALG13